MATASTKTTTTLLTFLLSFLVTLYKYSLKYISVFFLEKFKVTKNIGIKEGGT